jgi:hypothetical protein
MKVFSTRQVLEVTGLPPATFDVWCREGRVDALNGAGRVGTGNHRVFSLMQVLGVAVAAQIRSSVRGCAPSFINLIVRAFAALDEKELLKRFQQGRTHLVTIHGGKPWLGGRDYDDQIDVKEIYKKLQNL